ncbi:MAG: uroporphyrinogen-III C-methyltransferase [Acetobacteraceae bacterium]|nr:uroporphyrinogen-III C-methyltransferase [Acetobacteraceae bacterium]
MTHSPPPEAPPFPIFLNIAGACALVVGGGDAAVAKLRLLLASGAQPVVVDPEPCPELIALLGEHGFILHQRAFRPGDLDGVQLCYVAREEGAAEIVAAARSGGILVNAVDQPELCDFTTPAMVHRGPLTIAIGTEGAAPALARNLRARIEAAVPPTYAALVAFCRKWRARVTSAFAQDDRRRVWDAILTGPEAQSVLRGDEPEADRRMEARLATRRVSREGRASLVGAGPGDPDLLTLKAVRVLQEADVVLYDKLVNPAVISLARRDARRIDVGKRCGRAPLSQEAINRLILQFAQQGLHVVRLKGGDPFIFGRGGEELEALREAGVPVQVVPGITAACAAASQLQVPLTHRGVARSLHFITAHGKDLGLPPHDWRALVAGGGTLAVYMGVRTLPAVVSRLLEAGCGPATPAAAVENATMPEERRILGTVATIADRVSEAGIEGPTVVLIGDVLTCLAVPVQEDAAEERVAA